MKTKTLALALGGVVVLAGLAYAGTIGYRMLFADAEDNAVTLVPQEAFVYGNVFLDPSTDQKEAIRDLLEKFPKAPNPEEAKDQLTELFDEGLKEIDATFEDDIDPWLGTQVAGFAVAPQSPEGDPTGAFLIGSDDNDAAQAFIDKAISKSDLEFQEKTYEGVTYQLNGDSGAVGLVGDFVVIGGEQGFKDVVDTEAGGDSLEGTDRYADTEERLTDDRLATFYFDAKPLSDLLAQTPGAAGMNLGALGLNTEEPVGAALYVGSDRIVFESNSKLPTQGEGASLAALAQGSGLLAELPGQSWGAFGLPNAGEFIRKAFEQFAAAFAAAAGADPSQFEQEFEAQTGLNFQDDIVSWMGDLGVFVQGTDLNTIGGGIVIESKDPATSTATLKRIGELIEAQAGVSLQPLTLPGVEGFSIQEPEMPQPINFVAADKVVIAFGNEATEAALQSDETLADNPTFQAAGSALGEGFSTSAYFDIATIVGFAETAGGFSTDETYQADVKPWLDPLSFVAAGSKVEGDRITQRFIIGVE